MVFGCKKYDCSGISLASEIGSALNCLDTGRLLSYVSVTEWCHLKLLLMDLVIACT